MSQPTLRVDVTETEGLAPSRIDQQGGPGRSYGRHLNAISAASSLEASFSVWRAEPGSYSHPGLPGGESFAVVEGEATLVVDGEEFALAPGVFITLPPAEPSAITVATTLVKVSFVLS